MRVVNRLQQKRFELKEAILIRRAVGSHGNEIGGAVASLHRVRHGEGGTAVIGAGELLRKSTLDALAMSLRPESVRKEREICFIEDRVLGLGTQGMVWWRPPGEEVLWFKTSREGDVGSRTGRVKLPGLVFYVAGGGWGVFAVKGDGRPGRETKLWRTPFYNVWEEGRICTGNVELPVFVGAGQIDDYERAFFGSNFTHSNVSSGRAMTKYKGGVRVLWGDLLDGKKRKFPESSLVDMKMTVSGLMAMLGDGKERRWG